MDKKWQAKWIMDWAFYGLTPLNVFHKQMEPVQLPEHRQDLKNRHMLVRKKFRLDRVTGKVWMDITADDYYKVYINGKFVGQGPAPAYYFHYNYNRYDVTGYLKEGENIIGVHVYYQGLINRVWNSGDYRQGLMAEIYSDEKLYAKTDSSWRYMIPEADPAAQTIGYDTQYLENIDGRRLEPGWRSREYDDSAWKFACENMTDDHKLVLQETPPLEVYEIRPRSVETIGEGHYFIDFGHELTGQFKMSAGGNPGQVIEIRCGEELEDQESKSVRYRMRCNCRYQEFWTLSGSGDELEFYDYKAFRYVEVLAPGCIVDTGSFSAVVRHYPYDGSKCRFSSSHPLLNSIWSICRNGVIYGTQESFVDCPSREKGQYLGDMGVTAHSHIYLSGDLRMFRKGLRDFALSSFICPGLMAVAPGSYMQEVADFSLQWPMQLLLYYKHSGDIDFLKEMLPVAEGILTHFKKYQRPDGLLQNVTDKWNLVDWPENLRDGYDFQLSTPVGEGCHNVLNAFYIGAVKAVNEIRSYLNMDGDNELPQLKKAFIQAFYDSKNRLFRDSEVSAHSALHSNILPLLFGILPEGGGAKESIVDFIRRKGFSCGVYMGYFLLKALAAVKEYSLIHELLLSTDSRSWGNMIREGATTCFEVWGKEQKWNTSLCHPWASAPISVLIEDVVGLQPAAPGWREIRFSPHISQDLEHLRLELSVKTGRISVECERGHIRIQAPEGIRIVGE